jgi:2-methylcitrate dehydratase PrpD
MSDVDLSVLLARHVASVRFEHLSAEAVDGARKTILDTIGVCLAASGQEPAVRAVVDLAKESGGREESTILGFGGRVPAMMAAFANGALAHCLDFDDQTPWGQHAASSLVPATLALAERRGGVTGRELLTAVAIGQDLFNRMRVSIDWRKDWNFSTVGGVFSATAAAAAVLRLPAERIANALGIASMQCAGTAEVLNATGSDLRALYAGFPAKGAVLAASLAARGTSGVPTLFEGRFGIMNMYFGGRYDRDRMLDGLGERFIGGLTLYKRWPCVGTAHSHIHATIELVTEHDTVPAEIAEIRAHVGDYHQLMCDPIEQRRAPATLVDAKFSLPYLVAVAAVRRDVLLGDFTRDALHDPVVMETARKVVPVVDPSLDWKQDLPAGRIELVMTDGRHFSRIGRNVPGNAESPMDWSGISRKFEDCARSAVVPLTSERIERAIAVAERLESLPEASEMVRAVS